MASRTAASPKVGGVSSPTPAASSSMLVTRTEWEWIGRSRRHSVVFEHNTLSGVQKLWLDGSEYFKSSWRYKLTGCVYLPVDDTTVEVYINSDDLGGLSYVLAVDSKVIPPLTLGGAGSPAAAGAGSGLASPLVRGGPAISSWTVQCGGRARTIEYVHATLDVLMDGVKVEASGSFAGEDDEGGDDGGGGASGACYEFCIPPGMVTAVLRVDAPRGRGAAPGARLTVDGVLVPLRVVAPLSPGGATSP